MAQELIDAKKAELGLDKPFVTQYFFWLGGMLTGDMDTRYVFGKEVFPTFVSKLPATLLLTALSILMTVVILCVIRPSYSDTDCPHSRRSLPDEESGLTSCRANL